MRCRRHFRPICVSVLCVMSAKVIHDGAPPRSSPYRRVRRCGSWPACSNGKLAAEVGRVGRAEAGRASRLSVRRIAEAADITCRSWPPSFRLEEWGSIRPICRAGSSGTATALKKTLLASEQDRPDVRQARNEWLAKRQPKMRLERHRLVFVDETSTSTKMTRLRGRCAKGQRLKAKAPFGHWKTQTFVAGLRCHGLTAPFVVDGR